MKKNTQYLLTVIIFYCTYTNIIAQKQANIWCFGKGQGLDFNHEPPSTLSNSAMYSLSENVSICDKNGNLLFYSDGLTVWNSKHEILKNGDGLKGQYAVIIVPKPENDNVYYIFTLGNDYRKVKSKNFSDIVIFSNNNLKKTDIDLGITLKDIKLQYSLVDINKNTVTEKNKDIYQGLALDITAVKHHNKKNFWLITHPTKSNEFRVFLINKNGLQKTPIISQVGTLVYTKYALDYLRKGILKNNIQGDKLASNLFNPDGYELEIFDFDNYTGKVSNAQTLKIPYNPYQYNPWIHGMEFSPNGKKLYVTANNYQKYTFLYQFNLEENILKPKEAKFPKLSIDKHNLLRSMQLASDRKIYISTGLSPMLAVINQPNKDLENCDLEFKDNLFSKNTGLYLPQCTHLLDFDEQIQINKPFIREILFASGKAIIQEQYLSNLEDIVVFLKENPNFKIEISGHTDNIGNPHNNQKLSEARAKAVANFLIKNEVSEVRIIYQGFGDKEPIADNITEEGRSKNRRIEFLIRE